MKSCPIISCLAGCLIAVVALRALEAPAAPLAFAAGRAYAAAHCVEEPGGSPNSRNRWLYNFSTTCPRDTQDRNCSDITAAQFHDLFAPGGSLATFDGVEFDTAYNVPHTAGKRARGADCYADGRRDDGVIGSVNVYGTGVIEFYRKLTLAAKDAFFLIAP